MKKIYTNNPALLEVLAENGIKVVCNDDMDMIMSDEDAAKVDGIVAEHAPAAAGDYTLEDVEEYIAALQKCSIV